MNCILIVKHLPKELTNDDKTSLLKSFGATRVDVINSKGRYKNCAFAHFPNEGLAECALTKIHNINVLGNFLSAEFHRKPIKLFKSCPIENNFTAIETSETVCNCLPPVAPHFGLHYSADPGIKYNYPAADGNVLINICCALVTQKKFYTQVIHLMNKMNLNVPFENTKSIPRVLVEKLKEVIDRKVIKKLELSEGESELSSDENELKMIVNTRKRKLVFSKNDKKTNHLQQLKNFKKIKLSNKTNKIKIKNVFDSNLKSLGKIKLPEKIEISSNLNHKKLNTELNSFGTFKNNESSNEIQVPTSSAICPVEQDKIKENCLSKDEVSKHPKFKNYSLGQPSTCLYIKNVHKKAKQDDLINLYASFVNFTSEIEKDSFSCVLMKTGRMRGQAFVKFSNLETAIKAVKMTNGYKLYDEPIIVCFSRKKS